LTIDFIGTEDDYQNLCSIIENHYPNSSIECKKDKYYYEKASSVMPNIKRKYKEIGDTLKEYSDKEIEDQIKKYDDTVKPSISICVMGLYSSGKSAFINSLIGEELLPSATDPTTAHVCKITYGNKYSIRFQFDGKDCELTFNEKEYRTPQNCEREIIKLLQEILNVDKPGEISYMNKALEILNEYRDQDHAISDIIEIQIPFLNSRLPIEDYEFVIFDTPGSNSDSNANHFNALKDSLDKQTNALPIFVAKPDNLDEKDNDEILDLIKRTGAALDTTNAIVIINKADTLTPEELDKKNKRLQEASIITKWKSTGIFYMSSVMGQASSKRTPEKLSEWISKASSRTFLGAVNYFGKEGDMQLYKYNIVDESKKSMTELLPDASQSDILYRNSGLESVEQEIVQFAERNALYNKCKNASEYLQKAINLCEEHVKEAETELSCQLDDVKARFSAKEKELCDQLENEKNINIKSSNTEFQKMMGNFFSGYKKGKKIDKNNPKEFSLWSNFNERWNQLRTEAKGKEKGWALSQMETYVNSEFAKLLNGFSLIVNEAIDEFWEQQSEKLKKGCLDVISSNPSLTIEQQKKLKSVVLLRSNNMSKEKEYFNLKNVGGIKTRLIRLPFSEKETFDLKGCCTGLIDKFDKIVSERINTVESNNNYKFQIWANQLMITLMKELCTFNYELSFYKGKISEYENGLNEKRDCTTMLKNSKNYIDNLLEMQGEQ
jgi:GTPase SAR1 family protein